MLDQKALTQLIEQQVADTVETQVSAILANENWLVPVEQKIIKYTQDRILGKFSNSSALPEIVEAVKLSVAELFNQGKVPGIESFVDHELVVSTINTAVEQTIDIAILELSQDAEWLEKLERIINHSVVKSMESKINQLNVPSLINSQVDKNMKDIQASFLDNFSSAGIKDQATSCQLTILDSTSVFENCVTARDLKVVGDAEIKNLAVKGSINVDNPSWDRLSDSIAQKTLDKINQDWQAQLVSQVQDQIQKQGIDFDKVTIDGRPLVENNRLSDFITDTKIQAVGVLRDLTVSGNASINNTVNVLNKRMGINTETPEMALSVWDEEVAIVLGKSKQNQAYVGTSRNQGVVIGVNRVGQIEIDTDGLTTIKKIRVGQHRISHSNELPNYSGTKGDIVFNANPNENNNVFAWQCIGGHRWKVIRSIE